MQRQLNFVSNLYKRLRSNMKTLHQAGFQDTPLLTFNQHTNMVEAKNEILAKNEALSKQLQKLLKAQDTRLELYREFDM